MDSVVVYNTPHLMYWDWRIAADLFFGGIGVGAFLVAVLNSLYYKDSHPLVSKVGALVSPVFVTIGLLFMLWELGHPLRLHYSLTRFNVSSPLSWGGIFQGLLIAIGVVYAYLWVKPGKPGLRKAVGIVGIPVALIVGGYHGWLLTIVNARPLWNSGPATIAALFGFATTGMATVLLVLCIVTKDKRGSILGPADGGSSSATCMLCDFRNLLVVSLVLQGLTFFVWWIEMYYGLAGTRAALEAANAAQGPLFWFVGIGIGLVAPAALQIGEIVLQPKGSCRINLPLAAVTAVLILVGGFVFRYAIVMGGQIV
ncbi:MAG: dimethyl sulfoxide reductase anchor subunit [Planctomycetia bacterium]|nr:dimethyl sulfoxide reductase anchor subunit [Planctomycetia bacterium]